MKIEKANIKKIPPRGFVIAYTDESVIYTSYKVIDGKKKLVYHDCGDNVVTDWMRHAIMVMLTGSVFSSNGNSTLPDPRASSSRTTAVGFSMPGQTNQYHSAKSETSSGKGSSRCFMAIERRMKSNIV